MSGLLTRTHTLPPSSHEARKLSSESVFPSSFSSSADVNYVGDLPPPCGPTCMLLILICLCVYYYLSISHIFFLPNLKPKRAHPFPKSRTWAEKRETLLNVLKCFPPYYKTNYHVIFFFIYTKTDENEEEN